MEENNAVVTSVNPEASGKRKIFLIIGLIIALVAIVLALMAFTKNDGEYTSKINDAGTKFDAGDVNGSIADLEAYLKSNISDSVRAGTLLSLASAYAQKGSLEFKEAEYSKKAIDAVNESLKLSPNVSEAYRVMAYAYEIAQDYTNAIPNYEKAINLDQSNAIAYSGLGHAYDLMGDLEKAKTNYEKALSINASLDHAQYNLAKVLFKTGEQKKATELLNQIISTSQNIRFIAEAELMLGLSYLSLGDTAEAEKHINNSLRSDPAFANSYVALAQIRLQNITENIDIFELNGGDGLKECYRLVDKAIELNPNLTSAYMVKADIVYFPNFDRESKIAQLRKALEVLPTDITLGEVEKKEIKAYIDRWIETLSKFKNK